MLVVLLSVAAVIILFVLVRFFLIDKCKIKDVGGRAVLITGCGAGFGRALVDKCLSEGMVVLAGCRRKESADKLRQECKNTNGYLEAFEMDIASEESVQMARLHVEETLKRLDKELYALVNNAGIQANCMCDDFLVVDDYREAVEVNTFGTIRVTQAFKKLIKQSKGRIVFCTSGIARFPPPCMAPYAVSKWATTAYTECIRHELYDFGVKVSVIEPGVFRTPLNEVSRMLDMMNRIWSRAAQETRFEYGEDWLNSVKKLYLKLRERAPDNISPVTNAYFHALTARYPNRKYSVGLDSIFLYRPYSWLTPMFQELAVRVSLWITGTRKPACVDKNKR